jgi:tetratricopeptide (TPR) repeat protein
VALLGCHLATIIDRRVALGLGVLAATFAPATWRENRLWGHEIQLWQRTVERAAPENPGPWVALGDSLTRARRFDEALEAYQHARPLADDALVRSVDLSIACSLSALGHDADALSALGRLDASRKRVAFDRPLFLARAGSLDEAAAVLPGLEQRFGRDEAFTQLEVMIQTAPTLPKPKRDDALGAYGHAQAQYEAMPPSVESLGWLVINAPVPRAREALAQLTALGAPPDTIAGLRAILEDERL